MKIHLHVGKIVLDGLPVSPHGAPAIGSVIEGELVRLLRIHGLAAGVEMGGKSSGGAKPSFHYSATDSPTSLGINIARSVFGTLGESRRLEIKSAPPGRRWSSAAVVAATGSKK